MTRLQKFYEELQKSEMTYDNIVHAGYAQEAKVSWFMFTIHSKNEIHIFDRWSQDSEVIKIIIK